MPEREKTMKPQSPLERFPRPNSISLRTTIRILEKNQLKAKCPPRMKRRDKLKLIRLKRMKKKPLRATPKRRKIRKIQALPPQLLSQCRTLSSFKMPTRASMLISIP